MRISVIAAALALAGCAGDDRPARPQFHYGAGPGGRPLASGLPPHRECLLLRRDRLS
jgi:hypothetical protein